MKGHLQQPNITLIQKKKKKKEKEISYTKRKLHADIADEHEYKNP